MPGFLPDPGLAPPCLCGGEPVTGLFAFLPPEIGRKDEAFSRTPLKKKENPTTEAFLTPCHKPWCAGWGSGVSDMQELNQDSTQLPN